MEDIRYISTRGCEGSVTASRAILKGIAEDGGLYVPANLPAPGWDFDELKKLDYRSLAFEVSIRHMMINSTRRKSFR